MTKLMRYCEIHNLPEIKELEKGMDFRNPQYRREVFKKFYKFHLKYKSHPGGVYYLFPFLSKKYNWTMEQKLWFAFINGCTQNPCTTMMVFQQFPDFQSLDLKEMEAWHKDNRKKLDYDIDRRYQKGHLVEMVENYKSIVGDNQFNFFNSLFNGTPKQNFDALWNVVINNFHMFGRLSTFSYLEYLKIMGLNIECSNLFIYDASGSMSHRNGICKVTGRDDLECHKTINPGVIHTRTIMDWIKQEGDILMQECIQEFKGEPFSQDVGFFTLESTLCTYKSWHRENRRYANVYNDMLYERIKKAEKIWGDRFGMFWEARQQCLPKALRLEDNPGDPGLSKVKQNHYRTTGEVIVMDLDYPEFSNNFRKYEN